MEKEKIPNDDLEKQRKFRMTIWYDRNLSSPTVCAHVSLIPISVEDAEEIVKQLMAGLKIGPNRTDFKQSCQH